MTIPSKFKDLLSKRTLIIDTETTGLGPDAEIVEITLIDKNGKVLLDTLVNPVSSIPPEATAIHGITNEMVADAPPWLDVVSELWNVIVNQQGALDKIAIYNASYDVKLIEQSSLIALKHEKQAGINSDDDIKFLENQVAIINEAITSKAYCVMKEYAKFYGERRGDNYKWQSLGNAATQCEVESIQPAHRAKADCLTTLAIMKAVSLNKLNDYQ